MPVSRVCFRIRAAPASSVPPAGVVNTDAGGAVRIDPWTVEQISRWTETRRPPATPCTGYGCCHAVAASALLLMLHHGDGSRTAGCTGSGLVHRQTQIHSHLNMNGHDGNKHMTAYDVNKYVVDRLYCLKLHVIIVFVYYISLGNFLFHFCKHLPDNCCYLCNVFLSAYRGIYATMCVLYHVLRRINT